MIGLQPGFFVCFMYCIHDLCPESLSTIQSVGIFFPRVFFFQSSAQPAHSTQFNIN